MMDLDKMDEKIMVPWKEAATLILVAKTGKILTKGVKESVQKLTNKKYEFNYRVSLLKRSHASRFMAGAYVYPGGGVDIADFSPKWYKIFQSSPQSKQDFETLMANLESKVRPPVLQSQTYEAFQKSFGLDQQILVPDIALRITAIRETFEECGILLAQPNDASADVDLKHEILNQWRTKVKNDAGQFIEMFESLNCCPDLWSLYEWINWLTPSTPNFKRRFDTLFFICFLENMPNMEPDGTEIIDSLWCTPSEALEMFEEEKIWLAPPQVYEFDRLRRYESWSDLKAFCEKRNEKGLQRYFPLHFMTQNGTLEVLPGDDFYPENPDLTGAVSDRQSFTLEESRLTTKNLHRFEMTGLYNFKAMCNVKLPYDQLGPVSDGSDLPVSRL